MPEQDPSERRLYAGRWSSGTEGDLGDANLPVRFPGLWDGLTNVAVHFGLPPPTGSVYPAEIWEICCAAILTVLRERDLATARALVHALAHQQLHAFWSLYEQGCFTLSELLELLAQLQLQPRLDTTPRRAPEYLSRHLRWVVSALQQELKKQYQRGRGYVNPPATLAYIADWWRRRREDDPKLSEPAKQATYPQDEVHAHVSAAGVMSPRDLALFLVAKRYAISVETVRKSLTHHQP